jgi:hypothetical protein
MLEVENSQICRSITVGSLLILLEKLPVDAVLVGNELGNLLVFVSNVAVGYIDVGRESYEEITFDDEEEDS